MSAPEDRLIGEQAARQWEEDATAVLACSPFLTPAMETLAVACLALLEDRRARLELDYIRRKAA